MYVLVYFYSRRIGIFDNDCSCGVFLDRIAAGYIFGDQICKVVKKIMKKFITTILCIVLFPIALIIGVLYYLAKNA